MSELPSTRLTVIPGEIFNKTVGDALLDLFNDDIRENYIVEGWAQFPNGEWVVKLRRTLDSYEEE